jgi:hypothetical protein
MVTQGHCAFCLRSNPEMRGVISAARFTTWLAYLFTVAIFLFERFVFTILFPLFMANIFSMVAVNSIFGTTHDNEGENADLQWMIYNGSWFTFSVLCETLVRVFYNARPDVTLMGYTMKVIKHVFLKLAWALLKLTQMVVVASLFGIFIYLRLLLLTGSFAPALLGFTCYSVAGYITQSTWAGLMAWILVDMYSDMNFRDKYMSFSTVSMEVGKVVTGTFLDRIYNKPPLPLPSPPITTEVPAVKVKLEEQQ